MNFENCFPLWNDLNTTQKKIISDNLITQYVKKGTIIHNGNLDCTGLLLVKSGQLRTYILSDEGREITLYRLFDMDMCLLSASCIIRSIQFEVTIEAEKDTDLWIIPAEIYKDIMKESAPVANYTNELILWTPPSSYHSGKTLAGVFGHCCPLWNNFPEFAHFLSEGHNCNSVE